jgi:hypothetical protein
VSSSNKSIARTLPFVDEWGIYDPDQAGLAAVLRKLEARTPAAPAIDDRRVITSSIGRARESAQDR